MEKDQLISMIHFLVKRDDERAQENQELKDIVNLDAYEEIASDLADLLPTEIKGNK